MKKKWLVPCLIGVFVIVIIFYTGIIREHTFTLEDRDHTTAKHEEIQPMFGTVKVRGSSDTDVVFTDIETGETYIIGYITPGVSEKIKLQKGKWYTVTGAGDITLSPVNVRIE